MARISGSSDSTRESKVSEHFTVQHSAIKMLSSRLAIIRDYVKAVESGELEYNHEIMRDAKALADRLPVLETELFLPEFYTLLGVKLFILEVSPLLIFDWVVLSVFPRKSILFFKGYYD